MSDWRLCSWSIYWLVLRPVKKQALAAFRELPGTEPPACGSAPPPERRRDSSSERHRRHRSRRKSRHQLKKSADRKVKAEPEAASRLVQSWVREGDQKK